MLQVADRVDERLGLYSQTVMLDVIAGDDVVEKIGGKHPFLPLPNPVHYLIIHAPNYDGDSVLVSVSDLAQVVLTPIVFEEIKGRFEVRT